MTLIPSLSPFKNLKKGFFFPLDFRSAGFYTDTGLENVSGIMSGIKKKKKKQGNRYYIFFVLGAFNCGAAWDSHVDYDVLFNLGKNTKFW